MTGDPAWVKVSLYVNLFPVSSLIIFRLIFFYPNIMLTSEFDRFYYSLNNFKVLSMEEILVMQVIYWEACFRHMLEAVPLARYVQLWPSKSVCFLLYLYFVFWKNSFDNSLFFASIGKKSQPDWLPLVSKIMQCFYTINSCTWRRYG